MGICTIQMDKDFMDSIMVLWKCDDGIMQTTFDLCYDYIEQQEKQNYRFYILTVPQHTSVNVIVMGNSPNDAVGIFKSFYSSKFNRDIDPVVIGSISTSQEEKINHDIILNSIIHPYESRLEYQASMYSYQQEQAYLDHPYDDKQ